MDVQLYLTIYSHRDKTKFIIIIIIIITIIIYYYYYCNTCASFALLTCLLLKSPYHVVF